MATVQFSLTAQQLEALQELSNPGESLNLTAKRVLSAILSGNTSSNINKICGPYANHLQTIAISYSYYIHNIRICHVFQVTVHIHAPPNDLDAYTRNHRCIAIIATIIITIVILSNS